MILLMLAAVAAAVPKAGPVETLHTVVVEAIRNCPKGKGDEIVVCSRDRGIAEGFRLPRLDPRYAGPGLKPGGRGVLTDAGVAAVGVGSCSTVGANGATGCGRRAADDWGAWKRGERAEGRDFPW